MNDVAPSTRKTLAVLLGIALLTLGLVTLWPKADAAVPEGQTGFGRLETCALDVNSRCTVQHGFGVAPEAVNATVVGSGTSIITVDAVTATSYSVRIVRANGTLYPAGQPAKWYAHYDFGASSTIPPTSATPSPTPTASPSPTATGPSPVKACTTGQTFGEGGQAAFNPYYFYLNDWRDSYAGEQYRAMVCAADNWWVEADVPTHSDNGVEAYPAMQRNFDPAANLSTIQSVRFAQNTTNVAGMRWNVAVDAWLNADQDCELMIWTQWQEQTPAGSNVATVTIGGQQYQVWKSGGVNLSTGACGIVSYRSINQQTFGTLPMQSFIADMKARSWLPANNTTWQVNYGVEVVDTNGDATLGGAGTHRWNFTDHAVTVS